MARWKFRLFAAVERLSIACFEAPVFRSVKSAGRSAGPLGLWLVSCRERLVTWSRGVTAVNVRGRALAGECARGALASRSYCQSLIGAVAADRLGGGGRGGGTMRRGRKLRGAREGQGSRPTANEYLREITVPRCVVLESPSSTFAWQSVARYYVKLANDWDEYNRRR